MSHTKTKTRSHSTKAKDSKHLAPTVQAGVKHGSKADCHKKYKPKVCFSSVTPHKISVDCNASQFTTSLQILGTTRNLPMGTNIAIQYTREFDRKTAILVGTTTTDNFGNWQLIVASLVINTPALGSIYLFAEAIIDSVRVVAAAEFTIKVLCSTPPIIPVPGPYPCLCCDEKGCQAK